MISIRSACALLFCAMSCALSGHAQTPAWKPEKNVEIVVNTAAGGAQDRTARGIQKVMQDRRLVERPVLVVNKPGGGGAIALNYFDLHRNDAHFLQVGSSTLLTNHIMGISPQNYTDYTNIAVMFSESIIFAVSANSPVKSGRDLIEMLKRDPAAVSISVATSVGNQFHIAAALVARAAGIPASKLKVVVFNSGGESTTAALGGHVTATVTSASNVLPLLKSGQLRGIAISSGKRLTGELAGVPTWKEQKIEVLLDQWRTMFGPPGLSRAQIAYWEDVLGRLVKTEEWQKELEQNVWDNVYRNSEETSRFLAAAHGELKSVLTEIGLAK